MGMFKSEELQRVQNPIDKTTPNPLSSNNCLSYDNSTKPTPDNLLKSDQELELEDNEQMKQAIQASLSELIKDSRKEQMFKSGPIPKSASVPIEDYQNQRKQKSLKSCLSKEEETKRNEAHRKERVEE